MNYDDDEVPFELEKRQNMAKSGIYKLIAELRLRALNPNCSQIENEILKNGLKNLNLIEILLIFATWHTDGKLKEPSGITEYLEIKKTRFHISDDLFLLMKNSIHLLDEVSCLDILYNGYDDELL